MKNYQVELKNIKWAGDWPGKDTEFTQTVEAASADGALEKVKLAAEMKNKGIIKQLEKTITAVP